MIEITFLIGLVSIKVEKTTGVLLRLRSMKSSFYAKLLFINMVSLNTFFDNEKLITLSVEISLVKSDEKIA